MIAMKQWPIQQLSFRKKTKEWRKTHLDWADRRTYFYDNNVRKSLLRKKINYDLVNGFLNIEDMMLILNPDHVHASFIPENIQHYAIMNSKLNILRGEESKRRFDYRAVVTNPNAISEIEENKKQEMYTALQEMIADQSISEEDFAEKMEQMEYQFTYEWQDFREIRANQILNHYIKELQIMQEFNDGFMDALIVGEEIYQCYIAGGEPVFKRLNPMKVHYFRNGYSSKVEDADIVILIDFWAPGKIIETFYDVLSPTDIEFIDRMPRAEYSDNMQNIDERDGFINFGDISGQGYGEGLVTDSFVFFGETGINATTNYFDNNGNIRVLQIYWRSQRKIKKVKSYDPVTGEEVFNFFPENYIINKELGEEEEIFWINEAWEGTKIGKDIYLNMRPKVVQYNRLTNPSKCHFGIVGTVYNLNDQRPFSMVDMMKPYQYLYNILHDRLNKAIANNWGKILKLDLAMVPKGWNIEQWLHYAKVNQLAVVDSFKEGSKGAATGKLAGGLNNQSSGVIDADQGNYIQEHINLLQFCIDKMGEIAGITRQREGQTYASETVGGIERATNQSSHITEWYFFKHEETKKRALECLLETVKIAHKGNSLKAQYIESDGARKVLEIDGDQFAECDYGIVVDYGQDSQEKWQKLQELAQLALQNNTLSNSAIIRIWNSNSMAEITRTIERDERKRQEQAQQEQEAQINAQMELAEMQTQLEYDRLSSQENIQAAHDDTSLLIAQIKAGEASAEGIDSYLKLRDQQRKEKDSEHKISNDNARLKLERERLNTEKALREKEISIRRRQANSKTTKK